jgi:single-stranded-DNA-specific exonuclease
MTSAPAKRKAETSAAAQEPFLGVSRSYGGKSWHLNAADETVAAAITRTLDSGGPAASLIGRILATRGVKPEAVKSYLAPTLRDAFPDPSTFADMDEAARVIEDAIERDVACAVFADYDVDGGSSAALLVKYFKGRGRAIRVYVPDRLAEGYGPNPDAFRTLAAEGIKLIITVDCGANSHEVVREGVRLGMDVVIVDHHLMSGPPPAEARATVNPNRLDCPSGQGHMTASGVVYILLAALNREARSRRPLANEPLPDLMPLVDLAAMGTVCDVAPLTGINRALVARGIIALQKRTNPGLAALADVAGLKRVRSAMHLGWSLGPRLNAGGRIGRADMAAELLACEEEGAAKMLAESLHTLNAERRRIEGEALEAALKQADQAAADAPVVVVGDPSWHPGIIGILAGRVKERTGRPSLVLGGGGNGEPGKASGRSVSGVNLGSAVARSVSDGVALAGGGHAMACGATVDWTMMAAFRAYLEATLKDEWEAAKEASRRVEVDGLVSTAAATQALAESLEQLEPFGPGAPEPLLAIVNARVSWAGRMGADGAHVRCVLEDASGGRLRCVAFRAGGNELGKHLLQADPLPLHVIGRLRMNEWQGRRDVNFEIEDASPATDRG